MEPSPSSRRNCQQATFAAYVDVFAEHLELCSNLTEKANK